jgi:DNA-binding beta-propeller fold protein YncE
MKRSSSLLLSLAVLVGACREDLRQPRVGRMPPPAVAAIAASGDPWERKSGPVPCTAVDPDVQVRARIGGGASPVEGELFAQIADVAVGADDRVYVLDETEARVQVYDRRGTFLFRFAGKGAGPGELEQPAALDVANGQVYVLDGARERVEVYTPEGRFLRGWRIARHLPAQSMGQTLAVRGADVFVGLHYFFFAGQRALAAPAYGVLKTDTAGNSPVLLDAISADELSSGSFGNVPVPNRFVAADDQYLVVGDLWHREVRVYTRAGEPVLQFASCLPVDPNAEGLPPGRPRGAVGGAAVGSRLTPLGHGRFARLTPYIDPARQLRQRLEILDVPGRRAWAVGIPPEGGQWRRYTSASVGQGVVVFSNNFGQYLEWAEVALPGRGASRVAAAPR